MDMPTNKKPTTPKRPVKPKITKALPVRDDARPTKKSLIIEPWEGEGEGEKLLLYGPSGMGKTTLASLAPKSVFLGLDDGGRKMVGTTLNHVKGLETFWDVRDALQTPKLFEGYKTIVIDTVNTLQKWAEPYMFQTIKHEKGGTVKNIEGYGYGKGYQHLVDTMHLILQDLDGLVRVGYTVVLLAQSGTVLKANPGGEDFLQDGPGLYHNKQDAQKSVRNQYCEWCDHVAKIDYLNVAVKDKKATGATTRAVFILPEPHFFAKSRTITEPIIGFENVEDDSFWNYLFGE